MMTHKIIHQFGLAKLAGISRRNFFAPLIGLVGVIFTLGTLAQGPNAFRQNVGVKLQPGDIVYVDSGDAIHGGFVIKVNPVTGEKTVIASGGLLRMPFGVVIDADGQIIVSDSGRLIRIDPETWAGRVGWRCSITTRSSWRICKLLFG